MNLAKNLSLTLALSPLAPALPAQTYSINGHKIAGGVTIRWQPVLSPEQSLVCEYIWL